MSRIVALLGACALVVNSAPAALLAGWETSSQTGWGTQNLPGQGHANITVGGLTRAEGVATGPGASDGWGGEAWGAESYSDGETANRFITFTIAPTAGSAVSVNTVTLHYKTSTTGPTFADLQFKLGNGAYTEIEEFSLGSPPNTGGIATIDTSEIPGLRNYQGTITFRLVPYGAANQTGDFYLFGNSSGLDLRVEGTVSGSGGGDTTPPGIIGLTPVDNASNLPVPTTLTAVFNESIARGSGSILVKNTTTGETINELDVTDPAQVILTANQIEMVMATPLAAGTAYHVEFPAGAITDLAGTPNAFAGFTDSETWNFETVEVVAPPEVVVNKYFNGSPERIELLVTGNGTPGSTVDMRGMILKDFSGNIDADNGGKLVFTTSALWSAVPAGTLITLTNWAGSPDTTAADRTLSIGLTDTTYFTPAAGSPEIDLTATDMVMIKEAGSDPAGTVGGIHALAAGLPPDLSLFSSFTGAKAIASGTTGTNLGVKAGNSTATLADYMSGTDATGGLLLTLGDFGAPNNGTNAAFIAALRGRTAGQGDGVATVTNGTLTSPLLGQPVFDPGQSGNQVKVMLLAQSGTTPLTQATITIPAALGVPSGAVLSGLAAVGASSSVNGQTIQVTSASITTIKPLEVTISGISTPATSQVSNNGIYPIAISTTGAGGTLTPIAAQAAVRVATPAGSLHDNDANGIALDSGLVVAVSGTVTEADYGGGAANFNGFLQDASGGISIFTPGLNLGLIRGYRFTVLGTVIQTNGQTSIVPASPAHIVNRGPVPEIGGTPFLVTTLLASAEMNEGALVTIRNLAVDSGAWGPGASLVLRDPLGNTIDVRIQPGSTATTAPAQPLTVTGILAQSDGSAPFTGNYYLMPRDAGDVVQMSDLDHWLVDHELLDVNADADGDGLSNSHEYAFGLDPLSVASSNAIVAMLSKTTGKFSFTRRARVLTGLNYRVFTSTTLSSNWTLDAAATLSVTGTSGEVETVEVTLGTPAPLTAPKLFIRVESF